MNWFQKIASPEEYLATLGAPPETVQWIMSQPNSQFYINEYRQDSGTDLSLLQPPQKQENEPTRWELDQARWYDDPRHKWILVQLRKMRTTLAPARKVQGYDDYSYVLPGGDIQQKMREIDDWYEITNSDEMVPNIDIISYSFAQAVAASDEWHRVAAGEGSGKIYGSTNPKFVMFNPPEWKGWSIQKVVSRNDLLVEGNLMNHCVGKYHQQVQDGESEIYSLRDTDNEPHVTLEINPKHNEILQIMGNSDTEPDKKYKVYIKQWLEQFQKERPGLTLENEDVFNFSNLRYVNNQNIAEEIQKIVYQGNAYGLKAPLNELDVQDAYDAVIHALTGGGYGHPDTRSTSYIGPVIANIAWDADKYRAKYFGVIAGADARLAAFKRESENKGVGWLWDRIENNSESFYDFQSEEEYEKARSESLPYALDDVIATTLVELAKTDPFLPEHTPVQEVPPQQPVVVSWLKQVSQYQQDIEPAGRYMQTMARAVEEVYQI